MTAERQLYKVYVALDTAAISVKDRSDHVRSVHCCDCLVSLGNDPELEIGRAGIDLAGECYIHMV
jgi:hypothetical protein